MDARCVGRLSAPDPKRHRDALLLERLAPTNFTPQHMNDQFSSFAKIEQAVIQQRALLDGYPGGQKIGLLLDEWGVWDLIPAGETAVSLHKYQKFRLTSARKPRI